MRFTSFDGTESVEATPKRPDKYRALFQSINEAKNPIPRGGGLSYCLASAAKDGEVFSSKLFNRILDLDEGKKLITVESGITLGDLVEVLIPKKLYLPVLPGHPSITVGGAIGFNVHGKSQFNIGNFREIVKRLWLYHPRYGEVECSRESNQEIFDLTIGGMGLTGFITKAELKLHLLEGKSIRVEAIQVKNIQDSLQTMLSLKERCPILYSWNNLNRRNDSFGRGTVYAEYFDPQEMAEIQSFTQLHPPGKDHRRVPVWNSISIPCMTAIYQFKEAIGPKVRHVGLKAGSFPICGKEIYFHFFGGKGFREYQVIVPFEKAAELFDGTDNLLQRHNAKASLGSLKLFEGTATYVNFCKTGVCLSLDVLSDDSIKLFEELDSLTIQLGGIVNIAKDSRLSAKAAQKIFPEYDLFKQNLLKFDPEKKFQSALRERLKL